MGDIAGGPTPGQAGPAPGDTFSEATRYLSAGAYLDDAFSDRVLRELFGQTFRSVAPSYGFDVGLVAAGRDSDGVGRPMTDTHRLLDSVQARHALDDSDPSVTFLAAIVSSRIFEDVVEAGYTALRPTQFEEVVAHAKGGFAQRAYLHVPAPSRPAQGGAGC